MKANSILSVLVTLFLTPAFAAPQPDLVTKVAAGEIKEARASWWGFDPQDSTRFLQAAIDARDCLPNLIASTGSLWFDVPPTTAKLVFFAHGDGAERVHAQLADANGRVVWDRDNISVWAKFARDRPAPGLWKLSLARPSDGCFEDSGYSLAGVPGFLFLSPDKTWSFR